MKIIRTRLLSRRKLVAVNLFGILLAPKGASITSRTIYHEAIHTAQMKEMLYILFYLWYFLEWLIRLWGRTNAYRRIGFEREAYLHDHDKKYLKHRKPYSWLKLL